MTVVTKDVSVRFFLLEPFGNPLPFEPGHYPRAEVFNALRRMDPAAPEYRIKEDLLGGETLCLIHDGSAGEILGAYFKDLLNLPQTEYKGEVLKLVLREGEALVDGSYAMFFPHDVVGIVRTSSKAPGPAKIGSWLSIIGGVECGLSPLRDPDTTAQLQQADGRLRRLFLRARATRFSVIEQASPSVGAALRQAAAPIASSNEVGIEISANGQADRNRYGTDLQERVEELFPVFSELEAAEVWISGRQRPINLKRSLLVSPQRVSLRNTRRIGPTQAAQAIEAAYKSEANHIQLAARVQRGLADAPRA
jgi:hypothetical protein